MSDPLTLINLFTLPVTSVDSFVRGWPARTVTLAQQPGFHGTRLHRAISAQSPYQLVNIAQWASEDAWRAAISGLRPTAERQEQVDEGQFRSEPALYRVAFVTPDPLATSSLTSSSAEPLTLINLFTLPSYAVDSFVEGWPASTAALAQQPGFRGTRLHRAISPQSPHQLVNVARWDSEDDWRMALSGFQPPVGRHQRAEEGQFRSEPALYRVVSATPDPLLKLQKIAP